MTRDYALIILAGLVVIACALLIALGNESDALAPIVGLAGMAIGRLSAGNPPTAPEPTPQAVQE